LAFAPAAIPSNSAYAAVPKKSGSFKARHFNKKDHLKFKKVKKQKVQVKKAKAHPARKDGRFDKKKMHNGEANAGIFGIPLKKKGYKPIKIQN